LTHALAPAVQLNRIVADPIFTLQLTSGRRTGGLFDVLQAALDGALIDLPAMRAHQRAAVVTALAIIAHALRRYGNASLRDEWSRQIGDDALRVFAPHHQVAFLQVPTGKPTKRLSIEAVDCLFRAFSTR